MIHHTHPAPMKNVHHQMHLIGTMMAMGFVTHAINRTQQKICQLLSAGLKRSIH